MLSENHLSAIDYRFFYAEHGLSTIPIPFKRKEPPPKGWQEKKQDEMWDSVHAPTNIGIIVGYGNLVVFDLDTIESVSHFENIFDGLGLNKMGTKTKRGQHFWVKTNVPEDYNNCSVQLRDHLSGDIRFRDKYVLAAPSVYDGHLYQQFGDLDDIPWVNFEDLSEWITIPDQRSKEVFTTLPVPTLVREMPLWTKGLPPMIRSTEKGSMVISGNKKWNSRSEAIFSVCLSLILHGYPFETLIELYKVPDRATAWYYASWRKAIRILCQEGFRPDLARLYNTPIPIFMGKTGPTDYCVYLGILAHAFFLNHLELALPLRELALYAAVDKDTVSKSLKAITYYGLITPLGRKDKLEKGNDYTYYLINLNYIDSYLINNNKYLNTVSYVPNYAYSQELWRNEALGKVPLQIFMALRDIHKPIDVIMDDTLRSRRAIYEGLENLKYYGLVRKEGKGWIRCPTNLPIVMEKFGCEEAAEERRRIIQIERKKYQDYTGITSPIAISTLY